MRRISTTWRRKFVVPPVTVVDFATAEVKANAARPWIVFRPNRPKAAYQRSGVLGSNTRKVMAFLKRMGL